MITLEHVSKQYPNGHTAPRDVDLVIDDGALTVLIGPSGCGKTTTLKMINRLIEPSSGRILLGGEDVIRANADELRRRIDAVVPEILAGLPPLLSSRPRSSEGDRADFITVGQTYRRTSPELVVVGQMLMAALPKQFD